MITFTAVFLLSLAIKDCSAATLNQGNCCYTKTVGDYNYTRVAFGEVLPKCVDNCIYTRDDKPGSKYCFASGEQEVYCLDKESDLVFNPPLLCPNTNFTSKHVCPKHVCHDNITAATFAEKRKSQSPQTIFSVGANYTHDTVSHNETICTGTEIKTWLCTIVTPTNTSYTCTDLGMCISASAERNGHFFCAGGKNCNQKIFTGKHPKAFCANLSLLP